MSVEEYSFMFTMLFKYASSLVSNSMDHMGRFVSGVTDLVKDECLMIMLHDDMTLSILMVYAQYIEENKLYRIPTNFKRS